MIEWERVYLQENQHPLLDAASQLNTHSKKEAPDPFVPYL